MLCTAEINMADSVTPNDVNVLLDNAAWAVCSIYHTVLKASPGAAIFGRDMLFDIPFIANWNKIGDYRWRSLLSILALILTLVLAGRPGRDAESV